MWRLGTVSSRATCLVYYASAYGPWLLLVVVLHWAVVFLWLVCPGVSASNPPTVTTKGGALRATWLAAALAFLHLIAYANLDDNSSRLKAVRNKWYFSYKDVDLNYIYSSKYNSFIEFYI